MIRTIVVAVVVSSAAWALVLWWVAGLLDRERARANRLNTFAHSLHESWGRDLETYRERTETLAAELRQAREAGYGAQVKGGT